MTSRCKSKGWWRLLLPRLAPRRSTEQRALVATNELGDADAPCASLVCVLNEASTLVSDCKTQQRCKQRIDQRLGETTMKLLLASVALLTGASAFAPNSHAARTPATTSLAAAGGKMAVRPVGIGSAAPQTLITNSDLESVHDTSDEWIRTRTGIQERRVLVHEGTRSVIHAAEGGEGEFFANI